MRLDSLPERLLIAPGKNGVDQWVAAAVGKVRFHEPELLQVVLVVVQAEIGGHVGPGYRPGPVGIGFQQQHLLRAEQRVGSDCFPRPGGVGRGHEVGVGAAGLLGAELQHILPQCSQQNRCGFPGGGRHVQGVLHRRQVVFHGADRLAVFVPPNILDQRCMGYPQSQDEAARRQFGEGSVNGVHRHRVARIDIGDTRGENQLLGIGRHVADNRKGIPAHGLGYPQCRISPFFQLPGEANGFGGGHIVYKGPDAQLAEFCGHGCHSCGYRLEGPRQTIANLWHDTRNCPGAPYVESPVPRHGRNTVRYPRCQ